MLLIFLPSDYKVFTWISAKTISVIKKEQSFERNKRFVSQLAKILHNYITGEIKSVESWKPAVVIKIYTINNKNRRRVHTLVPDDIYTIRISRLLPQNINTHFHAYFILCVFHFHIKAR